MAPARAARGAIASLSVAALLLGGCELLASDVATRIRYGLRDAAARLQDGPDDSVVVTLEPNHWPDGCRQRARYRITLSPYRGGKQVPSADIEVQCPGQNAYATGTRLRVARTLSVEKGADEPLRVTLRKTPTGVEVAALQ